MVITIWSWLGHGHHRWPWPWPFGHGPLPFVRMVACCSMGSGRALAWYLVRNVTTNIYQDMGGEFGAVSISFWLIGVWWFFGVLRILVCVVLFSCVWCVVSAVCLLNDITHFIDNVHFLLLLRLVRLWHLFHCSSHVCGWHEYPLWSVFVIDPLRVFILSCFQPDSHKCCEYAWSNDNCRGIGGTSTFCCGIRMESSAFS